MKFIVSVVLIKDGYTKIRTQNKLYSIEAVSAYEAHGKAIPMAQNEFPEYYFHTICSYLIDEPAKSKELLKEFQDKDPRCGCHLPQGCSLPLHHSN